ncbi:J domain-containing protein [Mycolicibacterium sp.]|uniref:J domain-containing protein n=1 Tax=Mycolicibacterium sp. TaxID=2320850 RepID=UPI0037C5E63A
MASENSDPYRVLGVPPTATSGQIAHAYRTLLRALHPDTGTDDPADVTRLAAVVAAYAALRGRTDRAGCEIRTPAPERRPTPSAASPVHIPIRYGGTADDPYGPRDPSLRAGPATVTRPSRRSQ